MKMKLKKRLRSCIAVILSVSLFMTTLAGCSDQQESTEEVRKMAPSRLPIRRSYPAR